MSGTAVVEPFVLHLVDGKYLIFDPAVLAHLREKHGMGGVLIGTLAQVAQQNVFLGLPLQLMLEEAAYLVEHGHARVVDDRRAHREALAALTPADVEALDDARRRERGEKEAALARLQARRKREALERRGLSHLVERPPVEGEVGAGAPIPETRIVSVDTATREPLFRVPPPDDCPRPRKEPGRYDLYAKLHEEGYFLTPGLRFGAQFVAYPGDPLRFHSHFIASGHAWDESFPVMDIVGGGRLGTGVKKAWLVGGKCPDDGETKCFTVEWAGM